MHRRLSATAKGKGPVTESHEAPRTGRVKAQAPEHPDLLRKHSLKLIGRVTNKSAQRVRSLIPFFTDLWKGDTRPVGSDLGNGMFQFQFDKEADLVDVLEKRPYHYARWMVIVERWEPTYASSFPSMIPFWIKVQGIPVHLWDEDTIKSIGKDLGVFEQAEISSSAVRMRVQVNGRLPLMKNYIIEYSNGEEVTASLIYERLEKHCSKCFRLDHDINDCLEAKAQLRALKEKQEPSSKNTQLETQRDRDGGSKTGNSPFQFAAQSRLDLEKEGHREKYYQSTHHDESGHTYHRRQSNRSGHQGARIGQREGYTRSSSYRTHHSTDRNRNPKPHSEQDRSRYETNLQWRPRTEPSIRFSKEPSQPNAEALGECGKKDYAKLKNKGNSRKQHT
ncbi:hypothetical protein BRARA_J02331 [Brassica rapa]|uniref:DUF4283 domain-containing protein n=1 Tax=Brassica campestris TaxID=3711 RepID=A0A397XPK8_BRACM|nr:hypothetical protein BRARA_J02331 [Brassica rapa]